ncbi:MAG: phosphatidate cytidylyltransferase [Candidatus Marinimicrobia bacterium]|jgi:phosphatidate cytidylyltransferase|nr:phosphatidate cytidylyltransferase [Candidatus Neomarinimicrobiota bacterium]
MSIKSSNRTFVNLLGIPGILALLWMGGPLFGIFIAVVIILATREFLVMTIVDSQSLLKWLTFSGGLGFCYFFYFLPNLSSFHILLFLGLFVILSFFLEIFYQSSNPTQNLALNFFCIFYVGALLSTLIGLRNFDTVHSTYFTLTMVLSIWSCDSAAFYFGSKWGKKKILPSISPKKSWIGCIAGLISSFIVYGIAKYFQLLDVTGEEMCILAIISGFFGQAGDFAESLLKRNAGVKDSGTLLLGHGGVLDRFDSLMFASPLTYFYIYFFVSAGY